MNRLTPLAVLAMTTALAGAASAQDLRMTIWSANEAHLAVFNEIADSFTADRPDVSVTFESLPFASYTTTLTTQIAGGNPPDLAWILERTAADFVNSGILAPLNETFTNTEGFDYGDMIEKPTELWRRDGELYAVPFSTSPLAIFANTDLIEAAGARTPADLIAAGEWTWDNAMATAAKVAEGDKDGIIVRDFNYQTWQNLAAIWRGWDASPWSADGDTCGFADPEMVAAMTFIHGAIFEDGAIPGPGESVDFFAGDAAMSITQISRASLLPKGDDAFAWDLVPLPAGPAGEYSVIGQAAIGVFEDSENADLAVDFLAHMTNPENSAKLAQFFPPIRQSLLNADTLGATNPLLTPAMIENVVVQGIARGGVLPVHEGYSEIQQLVRAELDALWQPDADVEAVLGAVCRSIQPLL
ncbi:sugar ABC transporter substrate-binding protein [Marinovum sp. 2_MG-2023]|uniref:ABC transporter substrate-binding protein n=1 Tax=unclassified Marinovum TaxID=2647166 RepID=UPI0026E2F002|nr:MULTISPECIES: sugar ABC transporter substrate-binding protein [unclassified Marinovum]MDO6731443.1 sugar ABC transporter substrate-binding protein [Marinovum sp. 2_MG-2023]MDO6780803.1 sugar ABC transporter substrate-binding protein [Marinovum sp. 1_MG-2023]